MSGAEASAFLSVVRKSWRTAEQLHALVHPTAWMLARRVLQAELEKARAEWRTVLEGAQRVAAGCLLPTEQQAAILTRYEASIDRTIARCLTEIERFQRMRSGESVPPPLKVTLSSDK